MKIKNILACAMVIAALAISPLHRTEAATNCDFENNLKNLAEAKNAANESGDIKAELEARKNLINQAIDCSSSEALGLQSDVKLVDTSYSGLGEIQNRIISKFDDILSYYQAQKNSVNDLGLEGSKNFSANLKSWRDSNYVPLAEISRNFIIFAKNQYILQTAQNRFNQVSITLKTLQLTNDQKISDGLNHAYKNLAAANDENEQVKNALRTMAWPNNIAELMDSSLGHMKDAYQDFFDVSKEAQRIISSSRQ